MAILAAGRLRNLPTPDVLTCCLFEEKVKDMRNRISQLVMYRAVLIISFLALIGLVIMVSTEVQGNGYDVLDLPWQALILFIVPVMFPLFWLPYISRAKKYHALLIAILVLGSNIVVAALGMFTSFTSSVAEIDRELYRGISIEIVGAMVTATSILIIEQVLQKFVGTQTAEQASQRDTQDSKD